MYDENILWFHNAKFQELSKKYNFYKVLSTLSKVNFAFES